MMLDGKAALVTGGGNGIGRATALAMAREGARLVVADIEAETAAETVALVNAAGGQAIAKAGDLTKADEVEALIGTVLSAYGRLDCAFNNAGIAPYQLGMQNRATAEWEEAAWDRMIEINLKSVWLCNEARVAGDAGGGRRRDRQHGVDRRAGGAAGVVRVCSGQACRDRADQGGGVGLWRTEHPHQTRCARATSRRG